MECFRMMWRNEKSKAVVIFHVLPTIICISNIPIIQFLIHEHGSNVCCVLKIIISESVIALCVYAVHAHSYNDESDYSFKHTEIIILHILYIVYIFYETLNIL